MSDLEQTEMPSETPGNPGEQLRRERERRGLSLAQVAGELHMDAAVAKSLEAGEFDTLGAPIFVRGHLRNYARLLGLDADAVVTEYERLADPATPDLVTRKPAGDVMTGSGSGYRWVSVAGWLVLIGLLVLLGLWFYHGGFAKLLAVTGRSDATVPVSRPLPEQHSESTSATQELKPGADAQGGGNGSVTVATQPQTVVGGAPGQEAATQSGAGGAASEKLPGSQAQAAKSDTAAQAAPGSAAPDNRLSLELSLSQKSWVEIYDADNEPLLYDLLPAGASKTLKAAPPVRVFFGNASGVTLKVNGKAYDVNSHERDDHTARFTIKQP